ncbi:cation diffusion facilitator 10 [Diaporthe amygdali]|uniref:cation diffusion facilitator 10 n=1 Tax=Phomopsis amygdali TaxID=1214568 RepID=UPI0022FE1869|nr:cation diffusion facilitator 10 [Diaporthe amygdali]KAJ0121587.1 cation diffusion facilitator 10 [Diaporthe amygdali]
MTSPSHRRPSSLLLQQDEPNMLASKGHGTLTQLIRNRSQASIHSPGWKAFHDEEEAVASGPFPDWTAFRHRNSLDEDDDDHRSLAEERRLNALLTGPQMRSMRLIGSTNPRYKWERYWKTEEQLKNMPGKPVRGYYERTNYLIQQYLYIDKLLDSSLPHDLLNEYNHMPLSAFRRGVEVPATISEEPSTPSSNGQPISSSASGSGSGSGSTPGYGTVVKKVKRTPKDIYRPTNLESSSSSDISVMEATPLIIKNKQLNGDADLIPDDDDEDKAKPEIPWADDDDVDSSARIVTVAIYVNFIANLTLLLGKLAVIISVPSVSVLASLVDAALDFLSTVIVWITTTLISRQDQYRYPVGRRRLEPVGVLVFSVIMITSFVQVALEAIQTLAGKDHTVIQLTASAIGIMASTVIIKGLCWFWCRLIKNSSVQALADDAMTDIIFNLGSIAFPIVGYYAGIWWLDALGGLLLSMVVIFNWSHSASEHIKNLCGFSATADQRNILLYLTMRFAKTIRQIQGLQAYHSGDKLNVEVDIVLDASTSLKDSHDLAESLQYVLESVPIVDRAFVHCDYASYNLPTHMEQQAA